MVKTSMQHCIQIYDVLLVLYSSVWYGWSHNYSRRGPGPGHTTPARTWPDNDETVILFALVFLAVRVHFSNIQEHCDQEIIIIKGQNGYGLLLAKISQASGMTCL